MKVFLACIAALALMAGTADGQADDECAEYVMAECGAKFENVVEDDIECSVLGEVAECLRQIPSRCNIVDEDDVEIIDFAGDLFDGLEGLCQENQDSQDDDEDYNDDEKRALKRAMKRGYKRAYKRAIRGIYKRS